MYTKTIMSTHVGFSGLTLETKPSSVKYELWILPNLDKKYLFFCEFDIQELITSMNLYSV